MALRKVTIQIEELQYQRLRQESFDKHIPISELIRIHLEESKLPISHAKFVPSNGDYPSNITTYGEGDNKSLSIDPIPEDGTDVALTPMERCEAPNANFRDMGTYY